MTLDTSSAFVRGRTAFYRFGYSLLLLPAFCLFHDPALTYRAVMLINGLLMSLAASAIVMWAFARSVW